MRTTYLLSVVIVAGACLLSSSCARLKIQIGTPAEEPLKEYTLEGTGSAKVLAIPVTGFLSDAPKKGLFDHRSAVVQEVVSMLRRAEKDGEVKALLLEINSPGGSITASDMLYHELSEFKRRTGAKIVAAFMDVAASGGYYIALSADRIIAHPTTITGSVGVVLLTPKVIGLMDKLGITLEVNKSGSEKDIGSPFRPSSPEEKKIFQDVTDVLAKRFLDLVDSRRKVGPEALRKISSARIYLPDEALQLGLVDRVGYLKDAIDEAKSLAGLPANARVVVYRRVRYPNDNLYNTSVSAPGSGPSPLVDSTFSELASLLKPGFYYLWLPAVSPP